MIRDGLACKVIIEAVFIACDPIFCLLRRGPNLEYGTNAAIAGGFR